MKLKAFIVDDEAMTRNTLAALIRKFCPDVEISGMAENFSTAVEALKLKQVDIIFMDINLGDRTGFEVLDELLSYQAAVVFVTAYEEFALKAFKYAAINYLLKPVSHLELIETVSRIKQSKLGTVASTDLTGENAYERKRISIPNKNKIELVAISNIVYLAAEGSYTLIYLQNKERIMISKHLKQLEEILSAYPQFIRVHRSYIVNKRFINAFNRADNGYIEMYSGVSVPVGGLYRQDIFTFFEN
ncbi:MAG: LytTR family DNA-binding domain-containing protein [Candidatus Chryseobacterium colombiense]|nr:LytTR family DNA-binding domain-containing protein [Chryseobacterium sp.]WEK70425.1 MAG: LytTR family DNA-binding domain-containing protein [Chryseobacterium sp.]